MTIARAPGLTVSLLEPPPEPTPLRTDIAGIAGRTRRGPVLEPVRVSGWRGYRRVFGDLVADAHTPYAVRGYFDNGGQAAHVVRLAGAGSKPAGGEWKVGDLDAGGAWAAGTPAGVTFAASRYRVEAATPGAWANGAVVELHYRAAGLAGTAEVDVRVAARGEPEERFTRIAPADVAAALEASQLVRLIPLDEVTAAPPAGGPRRATWRVRLDGGVDEAPGLADYQAAVQALHDLPEPALLAFPDLHADLDADAAGVLAALLDVAAETHDRLVLLDAPRTRSDAAAAAGWLGGLRTDVVEPQRRRGGALYHPWVVVLDPLGGTARPVREVPSSGHVAGVISRLDRERGAYYSPANTHLYGAVDLTGSFDDEEQASLNEAGVNLLRCASGVGLQVWGARTIDLDEEGRFVAHRRLVHRLVRAIRRVAEPLVFETNGPELWLTFVRAVTTVLLEAFEAGALKGARPAEAFRVQCDDRNNPPEERDLGRVVCDIELAPAAPMEFIHLQLALLASGVLEVVEAA